MLDIIANNEWKRPMYFTGGSFGDDDYLWMKDYLQLDGMVYKLVPVKTKVNEDTPFDMGQIDADKMYDIVMKWDWGNGDRTDIYHDVETRRNSITYRTNLSRLMQQLILEGKIAKAKEVIQLAIDKMPIDYYGYYTMVEPFAAGYYDVGEKEKARALLQKLMLKYQDNLNYHTGTKASEQNDRIVDIVTNIERYRSLLLVMKEKEDVDFYEKNKKTFNNYNQRFERFNRKNE